MATRTRVASIGERIHRVSILSPALTPDGDGGSVTTWTLLSSACAAIESRGQAELSGHATVSSQATHLVTIGYTPNVTTKCKVVFGAREFGIDGIENVDERNRHLRLSCTERAA